jgi:glycine cleavage system H protein
MTNYLEYRINKFIFKIADDRDYTDDGLWVLLENGIARVGLSDHLQQRSGDMAFVDVKPNGTVVEVGDELAVIETIKVNISFVSPAAGRVIEVNPLLETTPEVINQDPYGRGWLALIELDDGVNNLAHLLDPHAYFSKIKHDTEQELNEK